MTATCPFCGADLFPAVEIRRGGKSFFSAICSKQCDGYRAIGRGEGSTFEAAANDMRLKAQVKQQELIP